MEDLIQLLRKFGHDMRVPLNTIISTGDMLAQGAYDPLTPKQEKAVTRLQRNNRRLLAILDDFMTYVKADAGELMLSPKPFDLRVSLEAWCKPIREMSAEKGLTFGLTSTEQMLTGDEALLQRIVQALLWNALAHTTQGEIQVKSEWTAEQGWCLTVKDSGTGITEADLPHIYEPFWRGELRPQLPTAGAGLGLPLSQALAKAMSGTLTLAEKTGGCTFCVQIPLGLAS